MTGEFDITALEKALSKKERKKKEKGEKKSEVKRQDKPLFVPVDSVGKEINPEDIKEDKTYGLKQND